MKKIKITLFIFLTTFISIIHLNAASFSMSSSTKQVSPNGSFTVSVGGDCIGRVNLSVSNGTLSDNNVWVEQGYVSVTVTAGGSGTVTVTATPVTGFSDSDANIYNPGSRSVSVNIISGNSNPSNPSRPTVTTPTVKKSNDNNLSSLTVSVGELTPNFDMNQTEYSLNLEANITNLTVSGTAKDGKAKIEGLGEKSLNPGNNTIEIKVIAENGNVKTYIIKAYVDETPQVYLDYKDNKVGIIRNYEGLAKPENFNELEHTINEKTIKIFTKEKLTLIYGLNESNEKNFYLLDTKENKILNKFTVLNIQGKTIYLTDKTEKKEKLEQIKVNETDIDCIKTSNKNYCILNTINDNFEEVKYLYEKTENTIQLYPEFLIKEKTNNNTIIIPILISLIIILGGIITFLLIKLKGCSKNEKIK